MTRILVFSILAVRVTAAPNFQSPTPRSSHRSRPPLLPSQRPITNTLSNLSIFSHHTSQTHCASRTAKGRDDARKVDGWNSHRQVKYTLLCYRPFPFLAQTLSPFASVVTSIYRAGLESLYSKYTASKPRGQRSQACYSVTYWR